MFVQTTPSKRGHKTYLTYLVRESFRTPQGPRSRTICNITGLPAEVLSGTLEAFRTERVLLELFAAALPDLCAPDAQTGFARGLERYIHGLRLAPEYRRKGELADAVARLARQGPAGAELAAEIVAKVERYVERLGAGQGDDAEPAPLSFD